MTILTLAIAVVAAFAAATGIFSSAGPGPWEFESIRGQTITIHGRGLYHHMSATVAPQGIAQDYVTLFIALPLLLAALVRARSGSLAARFVLAGTLSYFLVTYLFYLVMAMYNAMFLAYAVLLACSFFALALTLSSFDASRLPAAFGASAPVRSAGIFLILDVSAIALLWLSIVMPPLLDGTVIPAQVEHYTTLVVQGLDLGLLLPLGLVAGLLLLRRKPAGYLLAPVYMVFLALLMTALTAKVVAMGMRGQPMIPVVFIIPSLNLVSAALAWLLLRSLHDPHA